MARLNETNMVQTVGYGEDEYCAAAREKIRAVCQAPEADVHFLVGGTQTNTTVIASILRPWQGVLSADSGHINCHEAGAIEFTGHKVIALPVYDGKLRAEDVWMYMKDYWQDASHQHFVYPGMVYISYPTEFGTLYTKRELVELASVCRWYNIPLYIDGARLGYGLMSRSATLPCRSWPSCATCSTSAARRSARCSARPQSLQSTTCRDISPPLPNSTARCWPRPPARPAVRHAVYGRPVFPHQQARHQHGHADPRCLRCAWPAVLSSFADEPAVPHHGEQGRPCLQQKIAFHTWGKVDEEHSVARFATSWSTTQEDVDALIDAIKTL